MLRRLLSRLPAFTRGRDLAVVRVTDVILLTTLPLNMADISIDFSYTPPAPGSSGGVDYDPNGTPFDRGRSGSART